ncbi:hypothetical protein EDC04DRAFT_2889793 [Pisolithus marmoratus]|nr:hypothetical protein EDC04DRAFT_2889793 [Pisolithus marmoratus]
MLPPTKPSPPTQHPNPARVPPSTANPLKNVLVELQKELWELQEKFTNYISSHEACCMHGSHSSSDSSPSEDGHDDDAPSIPPPHSQLYVIDHTGSSVPDPSPPAWLVNVLSSLGIPPIFQGDLISPDPITSNLLHEEAISAIKLIFEGASPIYIGMLRDRSLVIATTARHGAVDTTLHLPHDPTIPTAHH